MKRLRRMNRSMRRRRPRALIRPRWIEAGMQSCHYTQAQSSPKRRTDRYSESCSQGYVGWSWSLPS